MTKRPFLQLKFILPTLLFVAIVCAVIFGTEIVRSYGNYHGVKNISDKEFVSLAEQQDLLIVDVRQRKEFEVSHIRGAVLADDVNFEELPKTQGILLYCTIGYRSTELGTTLTNNGFSDIYNLDGGLISWKNEGNPVYNQKGELTDSVHVYSSLFQLLLKNGQAVK
jgi:rhodanese-related sulfurtransferase